jgi:glycosyltransferase involved in cell wall biosynthesis
MTIAFIHPQKSFLPELGQYIHFFSSFGISTKILHSADYDMCTAEVEWHFLGSHQQKDKKNRIIIHEYASASTGPFPKTKDFIKHWLNAKPDYRIFLNEYVKQRFDFKDNIPYGFRDMGIPSSFLDLKSPDKKYDFIYTGSVTPDRRIEKLIQCFTRKDLTNRSLLILSKDYDDLEKKFKPYSNIHFAGPVAHESVGEYILQSRFAINHIPDKEPFNHQTSVKLLEYLALHTPVISSEYEWVKRFQQQVGANIFFIDNDFSNFSWEKITNFNFSFPDLSQWTWEKQIRKSGILEFLKSKFADLEF